MSGLPSGVVLNRSGLAFLGEAIPPLSPCLNGAFALRIVTLIGEWTTGQRLIFQSRVKNILVRSPKAVQGIFALNLLE